MSYSVTEIRELSKQIGRSRSCLRRWASEGCDLRSHASVQTWIEKKRLRETNVTKSRRRRGVGKQVPSATLRTSAGAFEYPGNGEPQPGRRGAAAALQRLEEQEERAHARLQLALDGGDPLQIDTAQTYWLRVAETLRRLDAGLELGRRSLEEQVPKKLACDVVLAVSDWCRISFMLFLSSEGKALMGIRDFGDWKAYAAQRFVGILHLTVSNSLKTNSPIPPWAAEKIKESWNVSE